MEHHSRFLHYSNMLFQDHDNGYLGQLDSRSTPKSAPHTVRYVGNSSFSDIVHSTETATSTVESTPAHIPSNQDAADVRNHHQPHHQRPHSHTGFIYHHQNAAESSVNGFIGTGKQSLRSYSTTPYLETFPSGNTSDTIRQHHISHVNSHGDIHCQTPNQEFNDFDLDCLDDFPTIDQTPDLRGSHPHVQSSTNNKPTDHTINSSSNKLEDNPPNRPTTNQIGQSTSLVLKNAPRVQRPSRKRSAGARTRSRSASNPRSKDTTVKGSKSKSNRLRRKLSIKSPSAPKTVKTKRSGSEVATQKKPELKNCSSNIVAKSVAMESKTPSKTKWAEPLEYMRMFIEKTDSCENEIKILDEHPDEIFISPRPMLYFLRCNALSPPKTTSKSGKKKKVPKSKATSSKQRKKTSTMKSFGFPRKIESRKRKDGLNNSRMGSPTKLYSWKKMGFQTNVPKGRPLIRYVTASCMLRSDAHQARRHKRGGSRPSSRNCNSRSTNSSRAPTPTDANVPYSPRSNSGRSSPTGVQYRMHAIMPMIDIDLYAEHVLHNNNNVSERKQGSVPKSRSKKNGTGNRLEDDFFSRFYPKINELQTTGRLVLVDIRRSFYQAPSSVKKRQSKKKAEKERKLKGKKVVTKPIKKERVASGTESTKCSSEHSHDHVDFRDTRPSPSSPCSPPKLIPDRTNPPSLTRPTHCGENVQDSAPFRSLQTMFNATLDSSPVVDGGSDDNGLNTATASGNYTNGIDGSSLLETLEPLKDINDDDDLAISISSRTSTSSDAMCTSLVFQPPMNLMEDRYAVQTQTKEKGEDTNTPGSRVASSPARCGLTPSPNNDGVVDNIYFTIGNEMGSSTSTRQESDKSRRGLTHYNHSSGMTSSLTAFQPARQRHTDFETRRSDFGTRRSSGLSTTTSEETTTATTFRPRTHSGSSGSYDAIMQDQKSRLKRSSLMLSPNPAANSLNAHTRTSVAASRTLDWHLLR